ncbi:MAG: hypothetical protein HYS27_28380 [Deltaproteobacteria bacterium]|nr:hypothetical protein [Deltaproteobacteria bacterium]
MARPSSLALLTLACLAALPAAAAQQSSSTFRGDGFDAYFSSNDGCRDISLYLSGSDSSTKSGPGQPQQSNYLMGYANIFDCDTQSWGSAYIDLSDADISARGPNGTSNLRGAFEVELIHWEQTGAQVCYTYEGWCWIDWNGNEVCEPAGEYCYDEWIPVVDASKTLAFDLSIAPGGDSYRGVSMGTQKGPSGLYRYRYTGTQRYGTLAGSISLDGEELLGAAYAGSWASVWTANTGSMAVVSY